MIGPLAGLRILDLTTVQMGPWCTRIVADLGAGSDRGGGTGRRLQPLRRQRAQSRHERRLPAQCQRQAIDRARFEKSPKRATRSCDWLPGRMLSSRTLDRPRSNGSGSATRRCSKANASIVYLGMVGYGSGGRYAGRPAYDDLIQAASAIPMLLQRSTGEPRFIPMAAIDRIVGTAAAIALLAGLLAKARTGVGQKIEVPMFETMVQFVMRATCRAPPSHADRPPGYAHPVAVASALRHAGRLTWPCCPTTTASGGGSSRRSARATSSRRIRASRTSPLARRISIRCTT